MQILPLSLMWNSNFLPDTAEKEKYMWYVVILVISDPIKEDRGRLRKRKKYLYLCQTGGNILRRKRMPDW